MLFGERKLQTSELKLTENTKAQIRLDMKLSMRGFIARIKA